MEIELLGNIVNIEIIKKNNKNIYFRFKDDGTLYITCNYLITKKEIKKIITENKKSLENMYKKTLQKIEKNYHFYYLGQPYTKIFAENIKKVYIEDDFIYAKNEQKLQSWYKKECQKIFSERINILLDKFQNIPPFKLRIRKMKTRWGVNNVTKKIITLNSELLKKDLEIIDYVIIHELCHFYEANHSSKFWKEVEKRNPNYKIIRKRLRDE